MNIIYFIAYLKLYMKQRTAFLFAYCQSQYRLSFGDSVSHDVYNTVHEDTNGASGKKYFAKLFYPGSILSVLILFL